MTDCAHCHNTVVAAAARWVDLAGQDFCPDGETRHTTDTNRTVVAASPTLGWSCPDTYTDPWGRTT